jgi:hypothetical protein
MPEQFTSEIPSHAVTLIRIGAVPDETGFQPLFDGKTLNGWDGDPRLWKVQDGVIVGSTEGNPLKDNTFLVSKRAFGNFALRAQVKLRNHNSGIQFRSEIVHDWTLKGLQADMAEGNWWGSLYDEKGKRGVIANGWKGKAETVVHPTDWNDYEVLADGDHIVLKVNGLVTVDTHADSAPSGVLGLQLHMGPAMEVEFRNIRIKELSR